ncbi:MAG: hypothetical protein CMH80_00385 [Nitrospinae bacterium]|nr:hypothetical protein [Nitrospinota bacterium]|tara:strand:+ start:133 stop:345 length:213 start_codon:yes stop_codon:yes gene_type:complete
MNRFMNSKWVKLIFSFAIIGSAVPTVLMDFTDGHQGVWTHYGLLLVGFLYFVESILWIISVWNEEVQSPR